MGEGKRKLLIILALVVFVAVGVMQSIIDPVQMKIRKSEMTVSGGDSNELMVQLPGQFIIASAMGFKEVIAGALWVRADTFFHMGQYQAIIPIVRLVTWLDPHNLDVFTTGAWHLDYNFVDEDQMSDKRYIPGSVALLKEGIANNPNIWDLYFELGWTHYSKKLNDQVKALYYMKEACKREGFDVNTGTKTPRPEFVDRMLAHQYEKVGDFDNAIEEWHKSRKRVEDMIADKSLKNYTDQTSLEICDRNLSLLLLRMAWRNGDLARYKQGLDIALSLDKNAKQPTSWKLASLSAKKDYDRRMASKQPFGDALKPLQTDFQVQFKKLAPKVFVISGKLNLVNSSEYKAMASEVFTHWYEENEKKPAAQKELWRDGTRVNWMLADYDYVMPDLKTFSWKLDTDQMVVWDSIYVAGGSFGSKIDLSRNQEFYPFAAKKYKLTVWVSPQQPSSPDFVQDRIGWKGEALRDKLLDTEIEPGFRCLKWEKVLTRDELVGKKG
ncbi:MAG: tetratricopeptide repeat protein [Armatimonadota bacterium]